MEKRDARANKPAPGRLALAIMKLQDNTAGSG